MGDGEEEEKDAEGAGDGKNDEEEAADRAEKYEAVHCRAKARAKGAARTEQAPDSGIEPFGAAPKSRAKLSRPAVEDGSDQQAASDAEVNGTRGRRKEEEAEDEEA